MKSVRPSTRTTCSSSTTSLLSPLCNDPHGEIEKMNTQCMLFRYIHMTDRDNIQHKESIQIWTCAFLSVQTPEAPGAGTICNMHRTYDTKNVRCLPEVNLWSRWCCEEAAGSQCCTSTQKKPGCQARCLSHLVAEELVKNMSCFTDEKICAYASLQPNVFIVVPWCL